jgi:hypothetical protein
MPKENIYLVDQRTDTKVQVGWDRNNTGAPLQIGVVPIDYAGPGATDERGLFTDLDRTAVNRLIRVLQKARGEHYDEHM